MTTQNMTVKRISKVLLANGKNPADFKIKNNEIEVAAYDQDGDIDFDATELLKNQISDILGWGGFGCAWGGWVLQAGYACDSRDYNDLSSTMHY